MNDLPIVRTLTPETMNLSNPLVAIRQATR